MRSGVVLGCLLLACTLLGAGEPTPVEQMEKLAPHASGLALVEVISVTEHDARPADGPLYLSVKLKILRASGHTLKDISIVKESGGERGLRPPGIAPIRPAGPVKTDTFQAGEQYWVAFASRDDFVKYPQLVVAVWPARDAAPVFDAAIRADVYRDRPNYVRGPGYTYRSRPADDGKSWKARLEQEGKLLWERDLPGQKVREEDGGHWLMMKREQWPSGLGEAAANRSGWYLFAETTHFLEKGNEYQLEPGPHRVTHAFDADSGKTVAVWVTIMRLSPTATPALIRYFDPASDKVRREERREFLASGGKEAGSDAEGWLRNIVRVYDVSTGALKSEEVFRHATLPGGSRFVPVTKR